nr:MAG TPA: tail collar domain [Caudoviricetes sp.]
MSVSDWSATADENTTVDGINIAEHCPAKNINNAIRSVMAAVKAKCDTLDTTDNSLRRGAVIGEVRWFAMSQPPEGWLVCNGAAVGTSDYPALFAAIGKAFTPEDVPASPATFKLPNLMGKVPWGSTSVGTALDAGLPGITGSATFIQSDGEDQSGYPDVGCFYWGTYNHDWKVSSIHEGPAKRDLLFNASRSNSIYGKSSTVQPPALCLLPCIRYE